MRDEVKSMILGICVLVLGLVLLLTAFSMALDMAKDPSGKIEEWIPEDEEGPTAGFSWYSHNTSAHFQDNSQEGDGAIEEWSWDFDDGDSSNDKSPSHDFPGHGEYHVTLEVRDENGMTNSVESTVHIEDGDNEGDTGDNFDFDLGIGDMGKGIAMVMLYFFMMVILVMVGGRVLTAGAYLIRPMPKVFKVKFKPSEIELDVQSKYQGSPYTRMPPSQSQQYAQEPPPASAQTQQHPQGPPRPQQYAQAPQAVPPPRSPRQPRSQEEMEDYLEELEDMVDRGEISEEEFERRHKELLDSHDGKKK